MAIAAIHKGVLFACLLGIVIAQENSAETVALLAEEPVTILPVNLNTPTQLPEARSNDLETKSEDAQLLEEQAKNAVYNFSTNLVDGIMGSTQGRQETRNGYEVEGSYWYSDGFVRRTISYVADRDGYRVVSEFVEPLGDGPVIDAKGRADIYNNIAGQVSEYSITNDDIARYRNIKLLPDTIASKEEESLEIA